jgi:hypothetical protein
VVTWRLFGTAIEYVSPDSVVVVLVEGGIGSVGGCLGGNFRKNRSRVVGRVFARLMVSDGPGGMV